MLSLSGFVVAGPEDCRSVDLPLRPRGANRARLAVKLPRERVLVVSSWVSRLLRRADTRARPTVAGLAHVQRLVPSSESAVLLRRSRPSLPRNLTARRSPWEERMPERGIRGGSRPA